MAVRIDEGRRDEWARIEPQAERLQALIRERDPDARFALRPGHDPEFWELDAFVRGDLADDPEFAHAVAVKGTEILLDDDAAIALLLRPRHP